MLSHRWKGAEITLSHIKRARDQHMRRKREESPWIDECHKLKGDQTQAFLQRCSRISGIDTETLLSSRDNDMHLVLKQCILDLLEQENNLTSLLLGNSKGISVGELLSLRISLNDAKGSVNKSRQDIDDAKSGLERTRREQMVVDQLSHKMVNQLRKGSQQGDNAPEGGDSVTTSSGVDITPPPSGASSPTCTSTTPESCGEIHEQEIKLANARTALENARSNLVQIQDRAKDSIQSTQLYELADELISRLQLWKSAIKLTKSIQEARSIFKSNVFPDKFNIALPSSLHIYPQTPDCHTKFPIWKTATGMPESCRLLPVKWTPPQVSTRLVKLVPCPCPNRPRDHVPLLLEKE